MSAAIVQALQCSRRACTRGAPPLASWSFSSPTGPCGLPRAPDGLVPHRRYPSLYQQGDFLSHREAVCTPDPQSLMLMAGAMIPLPTSAAAALVRNCAYSAGLIAHKLITSQALPHDPQTSVSSAVSVPTASPPAVMWDSHPPLPLIRSLAVWADERQSAQSPGSTGTPFRINRR